MADHRRDDAAAGVVDASPQSAEPAGGDGCGVALLDVAQPEDHGIDRHSDEAPAEILIEAADDEAALHFFAHTAGEHDDEGEDGGLLRRLHHPLEGIHGNVVQRGAEHEDYRQHEKDNGEGRRNQEHAERNLPRRAACAGDELANRLAVRAQEKVDEPEHQHHIAERPRDDERGREGAVTAADLQAGLRQRGKDQQLGREAGTEKDLDQRAKPFDR